ncbi:MAG: hypothetical protein Kow0013_29340 [Pararhodobacter sp.]
MIDTRPQGSSALLLFMAACVAGFGLGLGGLSALLPPFSAPALPLPERHAAAAAPSGQPATQGAPWPALFGASAPAPESAAPAQAEPEPELPDEPLYEPPDYVLRGLVVDDEGGVAMIETGEGIQVVRIGDLLPGGEEIIDIHDFGVDLEVDGTVYFLEFEVDPQSDEVFDEAEPPPGDAPSFPSFPFITGVVGR